MNKTNSKAILKTIGWFAGFIALGWFSTLIETTAAEFVTCRLFENLAIPALNQAIEANRPHLTAGLQISLANMWVVLLCPLNVFLMSRLSKHRGRAALTIGIAGGAQLLATTFLSTMALSEYFQKDPMFIGVPALFAVGVIAQVLTSIVIAKKSTASALTAQAA